MIRKQATRAAAEEPGQDSFLDIVANLVGILIILVMVIGVRAQDAMIEAAPNEDLSQDVEQIKHELADTKTATGAVESGIRRIHSEIERQQLDLDYRRQERDAILLLVSSTKELMDNRRGQLDQEQQAKFDSQRELIARRSELEQLQRGLQSARTEAEQVTLIEHLPTPMAKTVFGKELHFRLLSGRLTYIPWHELVAQLQQDAPQKLWRLKEQPEFTETLGPVDGFWLKYTLKRVDHNIATRVGPAVQQGAELDRFVLVPVAENLGEPFAKAFEKHSDFLAMLSQHKPATTTVTVWTYPDSFHQFRTLKKELFRRGYLTASRPLPANQPIGGSPRGTQSAAQ